MSQHGAYAIGTRDYLRAVGLRNGRLIVLTAFLDASACHPAWLSSVAGYMADADEWDRVLKEWNDSLAYWGLDRFHLAELPKIMGCEKAELCERHFSNIITRSNLEGIGAALIVEDWEQEDWGPRDHNPRMETPYAQALWFAMEIIAQQGHVFSPEQPVAVVCDIDAPPASIQKVYDALKDEYPNLHSLAVSDSRRSPQLQCADLAVGLLRRSWVQVTVHDDPQVDWGSFPIGSRAGTGFWSLRTPDLAARRGIDREEWIKNATDPFPLEYDPNSPMSLGEQVRMALMKWKRHVR